MIQRVNWTFKHYGGDDIYWAFLICQNKKVDDGFQRCCKRVTFEVTGPHTTLVRGYIRKSPISCESWVWLVCRHTNCAMVNTKQWQTGLFRFRPRETIQFWYKKKSQTSDEIRTLFLITKTEIIQAELKATVCLVELGKPSSCQYSHVETGESRFSKKKKRNRRIRDASLRCAMNSEFGPTERQPHALMPYVDALHVSRMQTMR